MARKFYTIPDCLTSSVEQSAVLCGSIDLGAGSLYNGIDNSDKSFFLQQQ